ncbi:hypothetical protein P43SY_005334 [Pythium insidiosum]|uniref:Uncharacterized protein n=1 Tax=Pythium insidiosum TaxID=114742 RepID=A0AAD5QBS3_PYTIN|nr:hypothetical protein P43SY_005334 [Pythium insidiosum]
MAGNKHKNGIVCMFPGCEKKMRTQKFKGHFIKMHLKEGEEYSVEHRRQFEVAQADPLSDAESAASSTVAIDSAVVDRMKEETLSLAKRGAIEIAKKTAEVASAVAAAAATAAAIGGVAEAAPPHPEDSDTASESASPVANVVPAQAVALPNAAVVALPPVAPAVSSPSRPKRPAVAISSDISIPVPPASNGSGGVDDATIIKILTLMDRRFNEITSKLDAMLDMQRRLLSTVLGTDPAASVVPTVAATASSSSPSEPPSKKRKESPSSSSSSTVVTSV